MHDDSDWIVRASAAEALGNLEDASILPDLEDALYDEEDPVRVYAATSIGLVASPAFLPTLNAYIQAEHDPNVRKELLVASYRLGETASMNDILNLIQNADEDSVARLLISLQDLAEWKPPASLRGDAERIREALTALAQRLPFHRPHVELIIEDLKHVEKS